MCSPTLTVSEFKYPLDGGNSRLVELFTKIPEDRLLNIVGISQDGSVAEFTISDKSTMEVLLYGRVLDGHPIEIILRNEKTNKTSSICFYELTERYVIKTYRRLLRHLR